MRTDRVAQGIAGAAFLAHAAVAHRYDFFRDELYFIACGRHPAFGYADQPPLVPLAAAATQAFGHDLVLLRLVSAVSAVALVLATCALARQAGATGFGIVLAGTASAVAPMYLGLATTLSTSTFEPVAWTLIALLIARAVLGGEARAWMLAGLVTGIALEAKYEVPLYLLPLGVALVATGHARALARREVPAAALLAAVLAFPSVLWQVRHGLPFLELMRAGAAGKNIVLAPLAFVRQQILVMNPGLLPLWVAGMAAPFLDRRFARWRFLSLAFVLTFGVMIAFHAKDYYLAPAYAGMFAIGGASLERWLRSPVARAACLVPALLFSAAAAPLAMPILDPPVLVAYMRAMHANPVPTETQRQGELPQEFADMVGWRTFAHQVADVVHRLPAAEQPRIALLTSNYGEAAALDFYGPAEGLPPALSGHNQYWFWGPRGHDGSVVLRINGNEAVWRPRCGSLEVAGRFGAHYALPAEDDAPILLCRGTRPELPTLWPELKHID
jgi:dolichyl-phosphate-mannose-protein mannosyltransferase